MSESPAKPLKVCLISSCYALSEEDRHASFLVESNRHLRERGVEVSVFAPSYCGCRSHTIDGLKVRRFRYFFSRWEKLTHMEGAPTRVRSPFYMVVAVFYIVLGLFQAVWFCRGKKFDIIHVHWPFPQAIWGYVVSRIYRVPMVITFHGAEVLLAKKFFFVKYFLRHSLRNAAAITCNSSFTAGRVRELGVDRTIEVIPYGVTVDVKPRAEEKESQQIDLLYAGRLIERKGVEYLLKAMPQVRESIDAHLHVVGDGDILPQLEQLANELRIGDHVTFHGFVSNAELENQYRQADVFVLPAIEDRRGDTEGLGVVLVEAISYLTPVVASNVGGIVDIVKDGETGLLVEQKNPEKLAAAIVRIVEDQELREKVVAGGLQHVQSYLDWGRITDHLMSVYRSVLPADKSLDDRQIQPASELPLQSTETSGSEPNIAVALGGGSEAVGEESPSKDAPRKSPWWNVALRLLFSLGILGLLFTQISFSEVLENLKKVSPLFVLFAWAYYAFCQLISSYRWKVLLEARNVHVPLRELFSFYMIGMFANNFMPGSVGGDVVKSYHLFRTTSDVKIAAVSVFLERFTGLIGLCLISLVALVVGYQHLSSPVVLGSVVAAALAILLIIIIIWQMPRIVGRLGWATRLLPKRFTKIAADIYGALASYRHHPKSILAAIGLSAILQFLFAAYYALASIAMGIPIDLIYFVLFLPLITLVTMIPLSIGGLGLREVMIVTLFGAVGISQADVLSVSLTVHIINTLLSLWGGFLLLRRSMSKRTEDKTPMVNNLGSLRSAE